jgi:hypothetical protein
MLASLEVVTHEQAAKGHLETAIWLWFHIEDNTVICEPAAIHTLAVATLGVLSEVARQLRMSSIPLMDEINDQETLRNPQNFFKHGHYGDRKRKKKSVSHVQDFTDLILAECVGHFGRLFKSLTPILDLFLLRYSLVFPESKVSLKTLETKLIQRGFNLGKLARIDRRAFYYVLLPHIVELTAADRAAFQRKSPPKKP